MEQATDKKTAPRQAWLWVLAAVYAVMLLFNCLSPMAGDDYAHYYGLNGSHIDTLAEIAENLANLRVNINGRVLAHACVYLMQIPPRAVFALLNAAVLPLLLWLMLRLLPADSHRKGLWVFMGAMLIWLFQPGFGEVFLWLTGSCNYGWALPLLLLSLTPFVRAALGRGESGRSLWLLPAAFCCGAYNENGAIALLAAMALLLLLVWLREKRFPWRLLWLLLAGAAGFALLLFAPATLSTRTGELTVYALAKGLKHVVERLREYFLLLYILYALLFVQVWLHKKEKWLPLTSLALVAAGLISALALSAAAYLTARCFDATGLLTALSCLLLMSELHGPPQRRRTASLAALLTVLFLFSFALGAGDILSLFAQNRARENTIRAAKEAGETRLTLPALVTTTHYGEVSWEGLEGDPAYWYNQLFALYHELEEVRGIPPGEAEP